MLHSSLVCRSAQAMCTVFVDLLFIVSMCWVAQAQTSFSFSTIDFPGAVVTEAFGVNDAGQVVGTYQDLPFANTRHGFLMNGGFGCDSVANNCVTIDFPGAGNTVPSGINNRGRIVGTYDGSHGFLLSNGVFSAIDVPGAVSTQALGINDLDQIVGAYVGTDSFTHGFLLSGGSFATIDVCPSNTTLRGINSAGQMIGVCEANNSPDQSFLLSNGTFSSLSFPGTFVIASGINNSGQIVGTSGGSGTVCDPAAQNCARIDYPGAFETFASGINNAGQIVGTGVAPMGHGFITGPQPQALSISLLSPDSIAQGQTGVALTITGTGFQPTSTVSFDNSGVTVVSYNQRTPTQIVANVAVDPAARPGLANIVVTNPDGQTSTLPGGLSIIAVTPPSQAALGAPGRNGNQQQTVAEPVSTGTGNYYYQHADFGVPGRGKPLLFERTYNSLDNYQGPLGANWTHTYNVVLALGSNATVSAKWGDGHTEIFTSNGSLYLPEPGVYSTLVKNLDGSFVITAKDQTRYTFSAAGTLLSCTDRNGNITGLTYDGAGNLIQVTDSGGRALTLFYDAAGHIVGVSDPAGRSESFEYDSNNNLVKTTDPAGGVTAFTYDANHHVLSIMLPNGNSLLQNTFDASGRVVAQTNGLGRTWTFAYATPNFTDTTVTDARGNATIHTYDALLRIVQMKDPLGSVVSFTYDGNNNRTSVTNQNGNTTNFSYDGQGNITAIKDPAGNVSAFTYDGRNNLLTATDAKDNTTTFGYDGNGNFTSIQDVLGHTTALAYDGIGQVVSKKDAAGNVTAYGYDVFGNLTSVTDALGHITKLGYDAIGRLTSTTDANGHTAHASYDALSRLVAVTDALNHQTAFSYDTVGNLFNVTDASGNATTYGYDAVSNLVAVTDALGHLTKYSYDENNNRTAFINAKGNATLYGYDSLNRLTTVTDPLSFVTAHTYDALGNAVAIKDANGNMNRFAYDALNRLVTISYGDGTKVAYSYDVNGNRTTMTDPHGTTIYAYDGLNRLTAVANPEGKTVQYQYNAVGNRQTITYPDGKVVTYAYDPVNRLSEVQDWLGRVTSYRYDPAGNLLALTYPNQAGISFTYDEANRLTGVANSFHQPGEREGEVSHHFGIFEYLLDAVGNRLQVSNRAGMLIRYSYDKLYELTGVTTERTGNDNDDRDDGEMFASYEYDSVGNRVRAVSRDRLITYSYDSADRLLHAGDARYDFDANGNQTAVTKGDSDRPIIYRYDTANRLISVTGDRINSAFSYDGDGNRIGRSVGNATFNYVNDVASTLPVVLQQSDPEGDVSFAYGLNLISESRSGFDDFYQYDGLGSIVGLTNIQGDLIHRYGYDAWGQTLRHTSDRNLIGVNDFRFTGEALDPGTNLYYLRARYYDPTIGRFMSRDPLTGIAAQPRTANGYLYAFSNPIRYRDPSGLLSITGLFQWFTDLLSLTPSADQSFQIDQQLSEQCGYTGTGNLENCTPQLQQQAQAAQAQAIQKIGQFTASQPSTIYGDVPVVSDLIWIWNHAKDLITIPVAHAQGLPSTQSLAGSPIPANSLSK